MLFVFEGMDGAGKTTQIQQFAQWLESLNFPVVLCRDPGSTELGNRLRQLLLERSQFPIHMRAEMLMFTAARTQLVEEIIRPAMQENKMIVLDRYIFSTVVYQGYAGQLEPDDIWTINRIATNGLMPDATFVLDLPVKLALERLRNRPAEQPVSKETRGTKGPEEPKGPELDRLESRGEKYFQQVRQGFLREADRWPDRVNVIDANRPVAVIQQEIQELARNYLRRKGFDTI
jgi:dTMP kinase